MRSIIMIKKILKTVGLSLLAVVLFTACSPKVYVQKDDAVNFENYRTFSWVKTEGQKSNSELQERKIRRAISAELVKAGWREDARRPDVLLTYDVLIEKDTREINDPVYSRPFSRVLYNPYTRRYTSIYYPSQFVGYSSSRLDYLEGTLTISLVDAKTDKIVWQGWTTDAVNTKRLSDKEIQSAVRNILKKFDVAKN